MAVSNQLDDPADLLPGEKPPEQIEQKAGWKSRAGKEALDKRKISCT